MILLPVAREDTLATAIAPDGREASVIPLTYRRARIVIGAQGSSFTDDQW